MAASSKFAPAAHRAILWVLILGAPAFAGCAGTDSEEPSVAMSTSASPTSIDEPSQNPGGAGGMSGAHHHNYWNGRTQVPVFDYDIALQTFPLDGYVYEACNAIGQADFDFEDDGNDDGSAQKSDVVYPGTSQIKVTITWPESNPANGQMITLLLFSYRPPNDRFFRKETSELPERTCGARVTSGREFTIPVGPYQFDPAHQKNLSRWAFRLYAYQDPPALGPGTPLPAYPPNMAFGSVHVAMRIIFGGDTLLDPPHPDFFGANRTLPLGKASGSVALTLLADPDVPPPATKPFQSPFGYAGNNAKEVSEIQIPRGNIVPIGALLLQVDFCFQYKGAAPKPVDLVYVLAYHSAASKEYTMLEPPLQGECGEYKIEDPDGTMADSPYENDSQWAFRIVPRTRDLSRTGYIEGEFSLTFLAQK